jgi:hypothetical protein
MKYSFGQTEVGCDYAQLLVQKVRLCPPTSCLLYGLETQFYSSGNGNENKFSDSKFKQDDRKKPKLKQKYAHAHTHIRHTFSVGSYAKFLTHEM